MHFEKILTAKLFKKQVKLGLTIPKPAIIFLSAQQRKYTVFPPHPHPRFLVTCFPNSVTLPIMGGSLGLISVITKVSIKTYYAEVNKHFRQTFSKQRR